MKRLIVLGLLLLVACQSVKAQEKSEAPANSAADALKAAPNDPIAWRKYVSERLSQIFPLVEKDPKQAEKVLDETQEFLKEVKPTDLVGEQQAKNVANALNSYRDLIAAAQMTMEEVGTELKANPDDQKIQRKFLMKLQSISGLARTDNAKAEAQLAEAKAIFTAAREAATIDSSKRQYDSLERTFNTLEQMVEKGKKLAELIGKDAAPLKVDAWVNGEPLTDEDLKGKVVLLDFWAIWCGPCIATFPHLREWHEKYEKSGLVIIGMTNYYGFEWDDQANRPKKAVGELPPEQEHAMLKKFAEHHELKHRFAIQKDGSTANFYGVTGIPHVVLIDQKGKIRLMRVGSGEENAKAISEMLDKLLTKEVAAK